MGLLSRLNPFRREYKADPYSAATMPRLENGRQQAIDTARLFINQQSFWASLRREERLSLFRTVYYNHPLAYGAVSILVKMSNSRIICDSGNVEVDNRTKQIWNEINGH